VPLPDRQDTRRGAPCVCPRHPAGQTLYQLSVRSAVNPEQKLPGVLSQRRATGEDYQRKLQAFVEELKTMPVAVQTEAANAQHYEVGCL